MDITEVSVDPSATCGDDPTAATGDYKVEVSSDGTTFTQVASGTFTPADQGRFNNVTLTGATTGTAVIRFTMVAPQVLQQAGACPGPSSGCDFMDMSEIAVHGTATP